ncbi:MAG: hypothetical protein F4Y75_01790 [Acidimicrobiia bacterium]|nr:hypothetical protein [Acidimicrobiia bacterium]
MSRFGNPVKTYREQAEVDRLVVAGFVFEDSGWGEDGQEDKVVLHFSAAGKRVLQRIEDGLV